jgi:glycosyltransferase involved in cell wall biosynthesis
MEQIRPIRVMQIIARMNVGGPAVIVAELMEKLNPSTFQLQLVTGYCAENEADYLDEFAPEIPVTRIEGLGRSVSILGDIKSFYKLIRLIRELRPDIIHTHTVKAGVLGRAAGFFAHPNGKRIHTFHGHLLIGYFESWKTNIIILIEKILAFTTSTLITVGNQVKDDLLAAKVGNPNQYSVIFPGLKELKIQTKTSARDEIGLIQHKTYIVFVGRLTQIKRPERLIEISQHLKEKHPNTELIIAGAGEKLEEIQELAKKESLPVVFLGWRNDIGRILSASDIAILCSDNEGIPLTLIQASQAGLPIVSTNVGSVRDIVVDGETGTLTEVNSYGLIHAIDDLLSNPEKMAGFGHAGRERAEALFSLERMINAHENLYSQVIEKNN